MPEAIAVAVADAYAFNVAGATVAQAALIEAAVYVASTVAINQVATKVLGSSSGQGGTVAPRQLSSTIRQSAAPRRLIYGRVKAGGILAYPAQSVDGQYVEMAVILGEGPMQGIGSVFWIADELSSEPKFAGRVELQFYSGGAGQTASAPLIAFAPAGEWTSAHIGHGIAWVRVRYSFERNAFPRGLALPAFDVQGRVCFDPRTGTSAWTDNPALIRLDHLRSEFGPSGGVPDSMIDFDSFAAAANVCDEVVVSIDSANVVASVPGRVKRYTFNGIFEATSTFSQIGETLDAAMGGRTLIVNGKYRCYPGAYRPPAGPVLTAEYLRGPVTYRTHQARQQRVNTARGTYREPGQDWQETTYHEQTLPAAVIAEDGEIVQTINFPGTTIGAVAQRLAKQAMLKARSAVPLVLECNFAAMQWRLWDVITVDLPQAGVSGAWLINGYKYQVSGGIDLTLVPMLAADYAWNPATDEKLVVPVVRPNFNVNPPALAGLDVVSGLVASDESASYYGLIATWTPTAYALVDRYEVQIKETAASDWRASGMQGGAAGWSEVLSTGVAYDVRVRIVAMSGRIGPWAEYLNTLVSGDATPPDEPNTLSVTGTGTHTINWRNPVDLDVLRARIYKNTVNDSSTATAVNDVFGLPDTAYSTTHNPGGSRYYWVSSLDRSGNESALEYAGFGA